MMSGQAGKNETSAQVEAYLMTTFSRVGGWGVKASPTFKPQTPNSLMRLDLMMENVDSGTVISKKLKEAGYTGPIYMLSAAGDTVRYNLDSRDLGLAGIIQKPFDPKTLVTMLKVKLKD